MIRSSRGVGLSIALLIVAGQSWGQPPQQPPQRGGKVKAAKTLAERVSGVIVKVEPVARDGDKTEAAGERAKARTVRITINSAVPWRDWARDQSNLRVDASPRREAAAGANSVATKGEPRAAENLVVIELEPESKVETRFRSPADETSKGTKNPAAAGADSGRRPETVRRNAAKPTRFTTADLRKGLFVEVDFHRAQAKNVASILSVIRPFNSADATAAPAK